MDQKLLDICYKKYNRDISESWDELARKYGYISGEALRTKFKKYRKLNGDLPSKEIIKDIDEHENTYKSTVEFKNDGSQISDKILKMSEQDSKDVDFILKAHGYSPVVFDLISARNSIWNVHNKQDGVLTLYSSKIVVKPKLIPALDKEHIKMIFDNLKTEYTNKINIYPTQFEQYGDLLVVAIADLHYNLLSEKYSTGNEYNLEIAEDIFYHTINNVKNRVENRKFKKVLFVIGNDFINADNLNGTTQKGTPQDNVNGWFNVVNKATQLIINGTDILTTIAPVDVLYVPSNHDLHTMFGIMQTVKAWYRNDENVNVDDSPLPRKYYRFGSILLALSHDMKIKDALQIITSEAKSLWSDSEHIICLLAHLHQAMVYEKQGYLEIMRLPTASGWSRWSNNQGYIQSEKKNQSFIVNRELGITDVMNTIIN
jgi:hypothetical protein